MTTPSPVLGVLPSCSTVLMADQYVQIVGGVGTDFFADKAGVWDENVTSGNDYLTPRFSLGQAIPDQNFMVELNSSLLSSTKYSSKVSCDKMGNFVVSWDKKMEKKNDDDDSTASISVGLYDLYVWTALQLGVKEMWAPLKSGETAEERIPIDEKRIAEEVENWRESVSIRRTIRKIRDVIDGISPPIDAETTTILTFLVSADREGITYIDYDPSVSGGNSILVTKTWEQMETDIDPDIDPDISNPDPWWKDVKNKATSKIEFSVVLAVTFTIAPMGIKLTDNAGVVFLDVQTLGVTIAGEWRTNPRQAEGESAIQHKVAATIPIFEVVYDEGDYKKITVGPNHNVVTIAGICVSIVWCELGSPGVKHWSLAISIYGPGKETILADGNQGPLSDFIDIKVVSAFTITLPLKIFDPI